MNYFTLFTALLFVNLTQGKECDCKKYKTGAFYLLPERKDKDTVFIYRTKDTHTEISGTKYKKEHPITWINDCKLVIHDPLSPRDGRIYHGDVIVKFFETGADYYKVRAWLPGGKKSIFTLFVYNGPSKI